MIKLYRDAYTIQLGGDPLKFGDCTPRDIDLLTERREVEWREDMEKEAWLISWLTAPHVKRVIKPKKIFDYERLKHEEEKDEMEKFEEMFMSKKEKAKHTSKLITEKLKAINEKKYGNKNLIS